MSTEAPPHEQMDAILLSGSAISLMVSCRYQVWRHFQQLLAHAQREDPESNLAQHYADCVKREEAVLRRVCELVDAAMQFIGDCGNRKDCVDEYGMTNAAFAAMDRALGRTYEDDNTETLPD